MKEKKLYEDIIQFFVFHIPVPDDFLFIGSRNRHDENAVGFGKHLLECGLDFGADIVNHPVGIVDLIHAVLDPATVFSDVFRELGANLVIGDIVRDEEHTRKI